MNFDQAKEAYDQAFEMLGDISSSEGRSDVYLKIDGIEGECFDAGHSKEIDVNEFGFTEWQQGSAGKGGGSGASRPSFDPIRVTCRASKAGPKLFLACAKGDRLKAVFSFRKAGAGQQDFMTFALTDAVIKTYVQRLEEDANGSKGIFDGLLIDYAKIEVDYKPQNADGSLGSPLKFGFDLRGK